MCEGLEERGVFGLRVKPWRLICGAVVVKVSSGWIRGAVERVRVLMGAGAGQCERKA